jgi:arabinose-5-phosphate isomerase
MGQTGDSVVPLRGLPGAAVRTVATAMQGLSALESRFADAEFHARFARLVDTVLALPGRVVFAGMGKSGLIARKIAATLISTGTPATFLHPAEAGHGDMGMITKHDLVVLVTRSGETPELAPIIAYCKRFGVPLVAVTSRSASTAAVAADLVLRLPSVREACPIELTPTTSTTVQLVFGDALAVALMDRRGFSAEDFHRFHPSGRLGARLVKVRDLMARGADIPRVADTATLTEATLEMTRARLGGTAVVDGDGRLRGVFTDGDLRRAMLTGPDMGEGVTRFMTTTPLTVGPDELVTDAFRRMQERNVLLLFVCDHDRVVGAVHMHDVLRAGIG